MTHDEQAASRKAMRDRAAAEIKAREEAEAKAKEQAK